MKKREIDNIFFDGVASLSQSSSHTHMIPSIKQFLKQTSVIGFILFFSEPRLDKSPFGNGFGPGPGGAPGLNPMAAQFMALNHPAHAAFLSQTGAMGAAGAAAGLIPGLPGANSSPGSQQQQAAAAAAAAAAQFMKGPGLTSLEALQR